MARPDNQQDAMPQLVGEPGAVGAAGEERHMLGLLNAIHQRIMAVLDHQCSRHHDPLKTLEKIFLSHLRLVSNKPLLFHLLRYLLKTRRSGVREQIEKIIRQYEYDVMLILRLAKRKGSLRAGVNTRAAAVLYVGMLQGAVLRIGVTGEPETVLEDARMMLRAYIDGISLTMEGATP